MSVVTLLWGSAVVMSSLATNQSEPGVLTTVIVHLHDAALRPVEKVLGSRRSRGM